MPDLRPRFDELLRRLGEISDLQRAGYLLGWDQETKMPPHGAPARAEQLATVARFAHDRATAPELGSLLEELNWRGAFGNIDLWLGLAVAAAMLYAAVRLRRYHDET